MGPIAVVALMIVDMDFVSPLEYIPDDLAEEVEKYYTYRSEGRFGIPNRFMRLLEEYQDVNDDGEMLLAAAKKDPIFILSGSPLSPSVYGKRGTTVGTLIFLSTYLTADLMVHELVHVHQNQKMVGFNLGYLTSPLVSVITNIFSKYSFIESMENEASMVQERFWYWLVQKYKRDVKGGTHADGDGD